MFNLINMRGYPTLRSWKEVGRQKLNRLYVSQPRIPIGFPIKNYDLFIKKRKKEKKNL